jgi:glyoxylase-like metal-dependent hydrolase (beta-lactamase superfamily II)
VKHAEIADGVHVFTYPVFKVNCTLVVGAERAMLVDTLSTVDQAAELRDAVRAITAKPLVLVNTHLHFDHCLGNDTLAGPETPIYGHPETARELAERGGYWLDLWQVESGLDLTGVKPLPPTHLVSHHETVPLGGREAIISYHGRGHTNNDLVVRLGSVLITGDLTEEGASPAFADSYPLDWPDTLAELLRLAGPETLVVPGHGAVSGLDFLKQQHDDLSKVDWLIRDGHADRGSIEEIAAGTPFHHLDAGEAELAVTRGFAQLDGML